MSLKTYRQDGTVVKARSPYLRRSSIPESVTKDPKELAEVLSRQQDDIQQLRSTQRTAIEYTIELSASSTHVITHNFGVPVSWWVVDWVPTSAGTACVLARSSTSDTNTLVLLGTSSGVARVRLEPSDGP